MVAAQIVFTQMETSLMVAEHERPCSDSNTARHSSSMDGRKPNAGIG